MKTHSERFWSKTKREGNCLVWTASLRNGYGAFSLNGKIESAHRVAYELGIGSIPKGKLVCHTCDNRRCVEPEHLWVGTHKDNTQDAIRKKRHFFNLAGMKPRPIKHGTEWGYKRKCRCAQCVETYSLVRRKHYLATGN